MLAPRIIAGAAALFALGACSSKKDNGDKPPPRADAAAAPQRPDAREKTPDIDAGFAQLPADPFAPIGVAECDAYIKKQRECIDANAPALIKDQQLDGLGHIATRWRQVAAAGATDHLVASCVALNKASEDATVEAWKCKW